MYQNTVVHRDILGRTFHRSASHGGKSRYVGISVTPYSHFAPWNMERRSDAKEYSYLTTASHGCYCHDCQQCIRIALGVTIGRILLDDDRAIGEQRSTVGPGTVKSNDDIVPHDPSRNALGCYVEFFVHEVNLASSNVNRVLVGIDHTY